MGITSVESLYFFHMGSLLNWLREGKTWLPTEYFPSIWGTKGTNVCHGTWILILGKALRWP